MKITTGAVTSLPFAEKGQSLYFDDHLKGFGVRVGTNSKSYFVQRDLPGRKTCRVNIGQHGIFTADQARKEARELLVRISKGENPNETKRREEAESITLEEAADLYLMSPKKRSKVTIDGYRVNIDKYLSDWKPKLLKEINRKMVYDRHQKIGRDHGPYTANGVMRMCRSRQRIVALYV